MGPPGPRATVEFVGLAPFAYTWNVTAPIQHQSDVHLINVISIVAGVWFIMSPAAFGLAPWDVLDLNNVICGVVVMPAEIIELLRHLRTTPNICSVVGITGAGITASPGIFCY